jgi:DNA ligase (NAD+)
VGEAVAESVRSWFETPENLQLIGRLEARGVSPRESGATPNGPRPLSGLQFVLTGTLESMDRAEAKRRLEDLGGKVTAAVSKKTDAIIAGREAGSKREAAERLGVRVLDESGFLGLLRGEWTQ